MLFVKFIIILVYVRGVVVFILYISCICWQISNDYFFFFFIFRIFVIVLFDTGLVIKFIDVGEFM